MSMSVLEKDTEFELAACLLYKPGLCVSTTKQALMLFANRVKAPEFLSLLFHQGLYETISAYAAALHVSLNRLVHCTRHVLIE